MICMLHNKALHFSAIQSDFYGDKKAVANLEMEDLRDILPLHPWGRSLALFSDMNFRPTDPKLFLKVSLASLNNNSNRHAHPQKKSNFFRKTVMI